MAEVQHITGPRRAETVAASLNGGRRARPAVVVSTPRDSPPLIDVHRIAAEVGDVADVFLLSQECAWHFSRVMPPHTQAYRGAGRVYPADLTWVRDPQRSPLRFADNRAEGLDAATALIEDTLAAAQEAGLLPASQFTAGEPGVRGTVVGCPTPSQVMIQLETGGYATVQVGLAFPGVPSHRLYATGMTVRGTLDPRSRQLDVRPYLPDPLTRMTEVRDGDVLPAMVRSVDRAECSLSVLPYLTVPVPRDRVTPNAADDVRDFVSQGEIVAVQVRRDGDGAYALSMLDVDVARCRPVLAALPGGPPWLPSPERDVPPPAPAPPAAPAMPSAPPSAPPPTPRTASAPVVTAVGVGVPSPVVPRATPLSVAAQRRPGGRNAAPPAQRGASRGKALTDLSLALEAARHGERVALTRLRQAEAELLLLERELTARDQELRAREEDLRQLRGRHRRSLQAERQLSRKREDLADVRLFADPEEQLRFEVYLRWAKRIPAEDKVTRSLRSYTVGDEFLVSLREVEGIERSKVVDVIVDVLTGIAESSAGREMHPLRSGPSGNDATLRRAGYTCWRVAVQQNRPSAQRLHFWRSADDIHLSRVVLHNDFTP